MEAVAAEPTVPPAAMKADLVQEVSIAGLDEAEEEPRLKYQRFGTSSSVPGILEGEAASYLCVTPKMLALGTHSGTVHLLDLNGNEVKRFGAHRTTVNELCFDSRGEYVGSCSDDGTVVVTGLYTEEQATYEYGKPVKTIALDPDYAVKKSRSFVSGGVAGNLILNSRGWLGNRDHVLHSGEGTVHAVRWCGSLIAWANDVGVKMYDAAAQQRICYIDRPAGSPPPALFRAHLHWASESLLLIGWADCVKVARVSGRPAGGGGAGAGVGTVDGGAGGAPATAAEVGARVVQIVALFQTPYFISGIAPFGDSLVLLAYNPAKAKAAAAAASAAAEAVDGAAADAVAADTSALDADAEAAPAAPPDADADTAAASVAPAPAAGGAGAHKPEVLLVSWKNEEISTDVLSVHGHEHLKANDYLLAYSHPAGGMVGPSSPISAREPGGQWWAEGEEPLFYVVSPKDVIVARPRDVHDRVAWQLSRGRFLAAMQTAEARRPADAALTERAGHQYLEHLLAEKDYAAAAALCPRVLPDTAAWERCVFKFADMQELPTLAPFLPCTYPLLLQPKVYELALTSFLKAGTRPAHGVMLELVRKWPRELYSQSTVVAAVQRRLVTEGSQGPDATSLQEVLAELYMADGQRERALAIYLQLQRPGLFDFIHQHKLYGAVHDKVVLLISLDVDRALALLVEQRHLVPPANVVAQLQGAKKLPDPRRLLHRYLAALFEADPSEAGDFHVLQVELYAEFQTDKLMNFLTSSQSYPLERALDVCKKAKPPLVREMVYVLGRMGSTRRALSLIMNELHDIDQAIEFVQGQQDEELWEELITHSLGSADLVGALLERIGRYTDPLALLRRLPEGMPIPQLRDRLVRILADYRTQTSLRHGCNAILRADCASLSGRLHMEARKAVSLQDPTVVQLGKKASLAKVARCSICVDPLGAGATHGRSVVVFFCGHAYHTRCLRGMDPSFDQPEEDHFGNGKLTCVVCRSARAAKDKV